MTERRAHWDDDLITAVKDAIAGWCFDHVEGPLYDEDVFPVIAAVEDWQIAKAGPGKYAITLGVIGGKYLPEWIAQSAIDRATKAEATIARVRELHGRHDPNCPYGQDCAGAGLCLACREEYPCATIRALDGSNSPPVTSEITGPLIDPDCRDGKHSSCVGGPCECPCHELAAP